MNRLYSLIIIIFLQLAISDEVAGSDKFSINSAIWLESKIAKITWSTPSSMEVISYNIFVNEGALAEFPKDIATKQIDKDATAWESTHRKTISALSYVGVDIRSPGQWGNKSVLTPGYIYTIGIEIEYLDKETRAIKKQRAIVILPPLGVYKPSDSVNYERFTVQNINQYNDPYVNFTNGRGFFLLDGTHYLIDGVSKLKDRDIFRLNNNQYVSVFYKPNRPELLGRFDSAYLMLLSLVCIILIMLAFMVINIICHMIEIWNVSTSDSEQLENIVESKIQTGIIGVLSLYFYIRLVKVLSKIEKLMYLGLELTDEQMSFLNDLGDVLNRYRVYQRQEILNEFGKLVESRRSG